MKRCPKAILTSDVDEKIRWWIDWKTFGCFPYAGHDLATQPAFVYDVLMLCEQTHRQIEIEQLKKEK